MASATGRYSIALPILTHFSSSSILLHDVLVWLEGRRNDDGSWGSEHGIVDRLVTTCQVMMTFMCAGYPTTHPVIAQAAHWLAHDEEVSSIAVSYWRLAPLLAMPDFSRLVQSEIDHVLNTIAVHEGPPGQFLPLYALKTLRLSGRPKDDPDVQRCLKMVLDERSGGTWRDRAQVTAYGVAVVREFDFPEREEVIADAIKFILLKAEPIGAGHLCWGPWPTSTAFILMDIAETPEFHQDPALMAAATRAADWLESQHIPDAGWPKEVHPQRSAGVVESPEYYTAVIARGLIAHGCLRDPNFDLELSWLINSRLEQESATQLKQVSASLENRVASLQHRIARQSIFLRLSLAVLGVLLATFVLVERGAIASIVDPWVPNLGSIITLILTIGGGVLTIRELYKLIRGWLLKSPE